MSEGVLNVKLRTDFFQAQPTTNICVGGEELSEISFSVEGTHGVALNHDVGLLARQPCTDEREQDALTGPQAAGPLYVFH